MSRPKWKDLPATVFGLSYLLKTDGTLMQDPRYGQSRDRTADNGRRKVHDADLVVWSGVDHRQELARWLASCGLNAEQIAEHFAVQRKTDAPKRRKRTRPGVARSYVEERDGRSWKVNIYEDAPHPEKRPRQAVTPATIRRWAGRELQQCQVLRKAALDHDLVRDVRKLRVDDVPNVIRRLARLRSEYQRSPDLWIRIVVDECVAQLWRVRIQACEWGECGQPFIAKRKDARYCPGGKCRKAAERARVSDNPAIANTSPIGREDEPLTEGTAIRIEQRLERIEQALSDHRAEAREMGWGIIDFIAARTAREPVSELALLDEREAA